jgi:hypothetical protein
MSYDNFLWFKSVVHHVFVPKDQTVNKELYLDALKYLQESVINKRAKSWERERAMDDPPG